MTTAAPVVSLNPDKVRPVAWWEHRRFKDKVAREAAELQAAKVLEPILTSQGSPSLAAQRRSASAPFRKQMEALFSDTPTGRYLVPSPIDLIELVERLEALADGEVD